MKAEEIKKRYDQLVSLRHNLDWTLDVIQRFVVPFRGDFFKPESSEHEVEWRRRRIFDSTAPNSCNLLASQIHGNLTSPAVRWFNLKFRDEELNSNQMAQEWLEECEQIMWNTLIESDFNLEAAEIYIDLCSFGTGCIVEEPVSESEWKGLNFTAVPVRETYFEPDAEGKVLRLYRRLQLTALQMIDKFGVENLPNEIAKDDDPDRKHDVIFAIYMRGDKKDADTTKPLAPENRPCGYKYVLHASAQQIGKEGGYYEMPAFVPRWSKVSGSRYGFSPAFIALSDILQLNEVVMQTSEARAKAIDPSTITTENGLISDLDLSPGGLTIVSDMNEIAPYESRARFDQADAEIDRLQRSIERIFFIDKLELKDSPAMTAYEVQIRYERMQRLLGPTLGRLQADFLDPLIRRTFMILIRAGQMPEMPEAVADADLDIEYIGPLPRAQKSEQADGIDIWMNGIANLGQLYPEMLDIPDTDAVSRKLGELRGVPAALMRDEDELEEIRTMRKQKAEAVEQVAMAQAGGEAMRSMAEGTAAVQDNPELAAAAGGMGRG
jgi:hypothetical protein